MEFEFNRPFVPIVSDCVIGVHCTHGVNRTGYLVCRYLVQKLKWAPESAIKGKL